MILKGIALLFLGAGMFVWMQVVMPVLAFKAWEIFAYDSSAALVNPSRSNLVYANTLDVSVENIGNFPAFLAKNPNYLPPYEQFKLTVPKIDLEDVVVKVASNDFEKNLAQLPGSALPGERGNVFISGHSSLSLLLHPRNQKPLFSDLPKMRVGDKIYADVLGQRFNYEVIGIKVVDPNDTSVIDPPDEGRYLTLMTCVPPGFNTKRMVVLAKLVL